MLYAVCFVLRYQYVWPVSLNIETLIKLPSSNSISGSAGRRLNFTANSLSTAVGWNAGVVRSSLSC